MELQDRITFACRYLSDLKVSSWNCVNPLIQGGGVREWEVFWPTRNLSHKKVAV